MLQLLLHESSYKIEIVIQYHHRNMDFNCWKHQLSATPRKCIGVNYDDILFPNKEMRIYRVIRIISRVSGLYMYHCEADLSGRREINRTSSHGVHKFNCYSTK